jgi:hypothetical protein
VAVVATQDLAITTAALVVVAVVVDITATVMAVLVIKVEAAAWH